MRAKITPFLLSVMALLVCSVTESRAAGNKTFSSVYTSLLEKDCAVQEQLDEGGYSRRRCPGFNGYGVETEEADERASLVITDRAGEHHDLDFESVVTQQFSGLGDKLEWRIDSKQHQNPIAIIVRLNALAEGGGAPERSYLVVAKITKEEICITDRIEPGANQNERARKAADQASRKACLDKSE